jgi:ribonuclease HI
VSHEEVIEAQPLPARTSAQNVELIALIRALTLGKRKRVNIYTDSKYAFLVLHAHAAMWKERGLLSKRESPINMKGKFSNYYGLSIYQEK